MTRDDMNGASGFFRHRIYVESFFDTESILDRFLTLNQRWIDAMPDEYCVGSHDVGEWDDDTDTRISLRRSRLCKILQIFSGRRARRMVVNSPHTDLNSTDTG